MNLDVRGAFFIGLRPGCAGPGRLRRPQSSDLASLGSIRAGEQWRRSPELTVPSVGRHSSVILAEESHISSRSGLLQTLSPGVSPAPDIGRLLWVLHWASEHLAQPNRHSARHLDSANCPRVLPINVAVPLQSARWLRVAGIGGCLLPGGWDDRLSRSRMTILDLLTSGGR